MKKNDTRPVDPEQADLGEQIDSSRRRFLKQIGVGAGGSAVLAGVGLPPLAHGQSREVDFSLLDAHPDTHQLVAPPPAAARPAAMPAMVAPAAPSPPAAQAVADLEQGSAEPTSSPTIILENRAMWIDPGYLVLLRWRREEPGTAQIAALEGATDAVSEYLTNHLGEGDLHDVDRLHEIEHGLFAMLGALVTPATIQTLHLDHDCNAVCVGMLPEIDIPLAGVAPMPMPLPGE